MMFEVLKENKTLTNLNLENNRIDDELIEILDKLVSKKFGGPIELPWKYVQLLDNNTEKPDLERIKSILEETENKGIFLKY
jgi:hypothetical protein